MFLADKAGDDKVDDDVHGQGNLVHLEEGRHIGDCNLISR